MNEEISKTKLDKAWDLLFEKYDILNKIDQRGKYEITAEQISEFREPRLITKFDHSKNLPQLFKDNNLSILPITRGSYVISNFNTYHVFESPESAIVQVQMPSYIQSLDYNEVRSESFALNIAYSSGIIADFTEDSELLPTVSGRMGSGKFRFQIKDKNRQNQQFLDVTNSQIEIDAAYEGINYLSLFEAKMDISEDFLVRQLYFPFRVWKEKITKKVKSIFLMFSNGIYRMYEYEFSDPFDYSSIRKIKQRNYSIEDINISLDEIQEIMLSVKITDEPNFPFPQADSIERVFNLCEILYEKELSRDEVTKKYDFDVRQTNYYTDAGRYLGLIEKSKVDNSPVYSISLLAKKILNMNYKKRQLAYCKCILSHKVFNDVLKAYLSRGVIPDKNQIINYMKKANLHKVQSDETYARRASTIKHWVEWIIGLVNV